MAVNLQNVRLRPLRALQLRSVVVRDWPMGKLVVVHCIHNSFPLSIYRPSSNPPCFHPYSASLISRPAGQRSDPRQGAIAPSSSPLLLIDPARSLARPSRWCHFLPRWNASCSGLRTDGRTAKRFEMAFSLPSLLTRFGRVVTRSTRSSLPPSSFNNAFLSLVMHLVRRALADRPTSRTIDRRPRRPT